VALTVDWSEERDSRFISCFRESRYYKRQCRGLLEGNHSLWFIHSFLACVIDWMALFPARSNPRCAILENFKWTI